MERTEERWKELKIEIPEDKHLTTKFGSVIVYNSFRYQFSILVSVNYLTTIN